MTDLQRMALDIRRSVIEGSKRANIGHIGSCLSVVDLLAGLYGEILAIDDLDDPRRDRFVMSKGHAALALYAALHHGGLLSRERLDSYCTDGSVVSGHPDHRLEGIEFSTGSLGLGLSFATGAALAARLAGGDYRVFALLSDAECDEGSVWESAMFASHHGLAHLVAIVDFNGQQAFGNTADVLDLSRLAERWEAFGWDVHHVDGHDPLELVSTVDQLDMNSGPPHVVIAHTVFGKGVSFMERQLDWHYWPMSDKEFDRAIAELDDRRDQVQKGTGSK